MDPLKNNPVISIITPSFNQGQYLEQTINSVLDQKYRNLQYIVIDGGSKDGSVEIIKKYQGHLAYWVSEKDNGQANAIMKGLQFCKGDIFNWLNSDDYLEPGALQKISDAFNDGKVDLVAGKVNNFSISNNEIIANQKLSAPGLVCWAKGVQFVQPGVWMRRNHFIECGGLDERFQYAFDWDMLIRYLYYFPSVRYLDEVLVNFRLHDVSKTISARVSFLEEEKLIIKELYAQEAFCRLHPICKYKMDRTSWTEFLTGTMGTSGKSRIAKIHTILTRLHHQPYDVSTTRMTIGAIKQILAS